MRISPRLHFIKANEDWKSSRRLNTINPNVHCIRQQSDFCPSAAVMETLRGSLSRWHWGPNRMSQCFDTNPAAVSWGRWLVLTQAVLTRRDCCENKSNVDLRRMWVKTDDSHKFRELHHFAVMQQNQEKASLRLSLSWSDSERWTLV